MKRVSTLILYFLAAANLFAQDCTHLAFMQKGKTLEMTSFNQTGTMMWKVVNHVTDVSTVNGTTVSTVAIENYDKNGHLKDKSSATYKCNGGSFFVDMAAHSSNIKMTGGAMEYPLGMKVGDHLHDVDMKMEMTMPGEQVKDVTSKITNRQVVAQESLTTPAGTWDALKITYDTTVNMPGTSAAPTTTTEWYVPDIGIIQYKLYGMTVKLTAIH
jgi:hypothetical protein